MVMEWTASTVSDKRPSIYTPKSRRDAFYFRLSSLMLIKNQGSPSGGEITIFGACDLAAQVRSQSVGSSPWKNYRGDTYTRLPEGAYAPSSVGCPSAAIVAQSPVMGCG